MKKIALATFAVLALCFAVEVAEAIPTNGNRGRAGNGRFNNFRGNRFGFGFRGIPLGFGLGFNNFNSFNRFNNFGGVGYGYGGVQRQFIRQPVVVEEIIEEEPVVVRRFVRSGNVGYNGLNGVGDGCAILNNGRFNGFRRGY